MYRAFVLAALALAGCEAAGFTFYAPTPKGQVARGRQLFYARGMGAVPYACVDCHTDEPEDPATPALTAGHSLYDAAARGSWYGGRFETRVVQGAQLCLTERMQAKKLEGDDLEALQAYLASISPSRKAPPLQEGPPVASSQISAEELAEVRAELGLEGDGGEEILRGRILFARACESCHNEALHLGPPPKRLARPASDLVALLRAGKGSMPPFGLDRISDGDLRDIAAFLQALATYPSP